VHAYDVVPTYDLAYVARRNIVHAYDVVAQLDAAGKSGKATVSATDILLIPEWFFRVNKALKIFEFYAPYELATASAASAIYAGDLSTVYDLGASVNAAKAVYAFDKLVSDGASHAKSYSPLFFALFQRRPRVRYLTLSVADGAGISDCASVKKVVAVSISDYVITDSASAKGAVAVLAADYGLLADMSDLRNRAIAVYDVIPIVDYGTAVRAVLLEVKDYILVNDYIGAEKVPVITASDVLLADSISTSKSYSPLLFAILRRKVPVVYKMLAVLDAVSAKDSASVVKIKAVSGADYVVSDYAGVKRVGIAASDYAVSDYGSYVKTKAVYASDYIASDSASTAQTKRMFVSDYVVFDLASYVKSYSPLFFSLLRRRVPVAYNTLSAFDTATVKDAASVVLIKKVSVGDYVSADSGIVRGVASVLANDYGLLADSYGVKNLAVHAFDIVAVADYGNAVKAKVAEASDYLSAADYAGSKKAVAITALERLITDGISYSRSYSPMFFTLFRRRVPVAYKTLSVTDVLAVADTASSVKIKMVSGADYVVSDYAGAKQVGISAFDYAVSDYGSYVKTKAVYASDYIASDSASAAKIKVASASDYIMFESASYAKSYSPLFFSILRRKVPIVYKTLSVLDAVTVKDDVSMVKKKVVSASDYVLRDSASYVKSYSPLFFLSLQVAIPVRYLTLDVADVLAVSDSAVSKAKKTVSVFDYVMYDYVPSMSPSDILFESMYANSAVNGVSATDVYTLYEHVRVIKRSVVVNDMVAMFENVSAVKL